MITQTDLDVRAVEPKHRLETIMSAWKRLHSGDELELTVDHDPKCMYYTLVVDHGEAAFSFEYLESGPLVWKVKVTRK
jgi:uncharacterized protein (DUF2249 family)